MDDRREFVVGGGYLNEEVFNVWKTDDEFLALKRTYRNLLNPVEGETEEQRRRRVDEASAVQSKILDFEVDSRKYTSLDHPDPLVRKLTLQTSWLIGPWYRESLQRLAEQLPDDPWVVDALRVAEERWVKTQAQNKIAIGTEILDFEAEDLAGQSFAFKELMTDSSIVLLEFWASWCGPCRSEIPHMKQAYERFGEQGFDIVSFTIDDSLEDWQVASEEEELPWHNLGMGTDAEAAKKYFISGVPKNYLVNAETGLILATDLRGHHLDERLEEELL